MTVDELYEYTLDKISEKTERSVYEMSSEKLDEIRLFCEVTAEIFGNKEICIDGVAVDYDGREDALKLFFITGGFTLSGSALKDFVESIFMADRVEIVGGDDDTVCIVLYLDALFGGVEPIYNE